MAFRRLAIVGATAFGAGFSLSNFFNWRDRSSSSSSSSSSSRLTTYSVNDIGFNKPIFSTLMERSVIKAEGPNDIVKQDALVPVKPGSKDTSSLVSSTRMSEIMKYGYPSLDNLRLFENYALSYDRRNRVANWVFERLTHASIKPGEAVDRGKSEFKEDFQLHPFFRSTNSDYKGSGYDRGHLACAANHRSNQKHMDDTFYLCNIAPQVGEGFNRDKWNELEKHVRGLVKKYENVWVCTGPLYLPRRESDNKLYVRYEVIGANNVAVPTHFFKVVLCETKNGDYELFSYVMPNAVCSNEIPLDRYLVPIDSIERSAGFLLFDRLMKNKIKMINGKKA